MNARWFSLLALGALLVGSAAVGRLGSPEPVPEPTAVHGAALDGSNDTAPPPPSIYGRPAALRTALPPRVSRAQAVITPPAPAMRDGYVSVSFRLLASFACSSDDSAARALARIPAAIRSLDGKVAAVSGFMIPLGLSERGVTEFVLVRNQLLCCYGQVPALNEWVMVTMASPVAAITDRPIAVRGTLHVGPEPAEGPVANLYRMQGTVLEEMP